MKETLKGIARLVFGDYSVYRILTYPDSGMRASIAADSGGGSIRCVSADDILRSSDQVVREQSWYCGSEAIAFGWFEDGQVVAVCIYWFGERYRTRGYWPLADTEAKLVQIVTAPELRGRQIAARLISGSAESMVTRGFTRLFARVWFTNTPSLRAFARAGWRNAGTVVEVNPWRTRQPIRLELGKGGRGR